MTKSHVVFIEQPYIVKVSRVLAAKVKDYSVKDWLDWQTTERNRFYLIEKSSGKIVNLEILSKDPFFFMHIVNCYQEGNKASKLVLKLYSTYIHNHS
jgi:carotenoid cleavage dioxygenase-like enzyme